MENCFQYLNTLWTQCPSCVPMTGRWHSQKYANNQFVCFYIWIIFWFWFLFFFPETWKSMYSTSAWSSGDCWRIVCCDFGLKAMEALARGSHMSIYSLDWPQEPLLPVLCPQVKLMSGSVGLVPGMVGLQSWTLTSRTFTLAIPISLVGCVLVSLKGGVRGAVVV